MSDLESILEWLVDDVDGALVAALGGMDGLLIERVPEDTDGRDLHAAAAQVTELLATADGVVGEPLRGGEVDEVMIGGERVITYVRRVAPELFLLLVMNASGNVGKARLFGGRARDAIREVFG